MHALRLWKPATCGTATVDRDRRLTATAATPSRARVCASMEASGPDLDVMESASLEALLRRGEQLEEEARPRTWCTATPCTFHQVPC